MGHPNTCMLDILGSKLNVIYFRYIIFKWSYMYLKIMTLSIAALLNIYNIEIHVLSVIRMYVFICISKSMQQ